MAGLLYVEAEADVPAEVRINDVPVTRLKPANAGSRAFVSGASKVRRGNNELAIVLVSDPSRTPREGDPAKLSARVAILEDGDLAFEGEGQTLGKIDWTPIGRETERRVAFTSSLGPVTWAWEGAPPLPTLSPQLVESAKSFADRIDGYHQEGNAAAILALSEPRLQDLVKAYPSHTRSSIIASITHDIALDAPHRPLVHSPFKPVLCGGGRLLECMGEDGDPYVRALDVNGKATYMGLIIGRFPTDWIILA